MTIVEAIRRYPLCNLLRLDQLKPWLRASAQMQVGKGDWIVQEGQVGTSIHLVLDGEVDAFRRTSKNQEVAMGKYRTGSAFGEYALLSPFRNTASCRAATPANLLRLPLLHLSHQLSTLGCGPTVLKDWLRLHGLVAYLREEPFLDFMSAETALAFQDELVPRTFSANETIQSAGVREDTWFFVVEGSVQMNGELGMGAPDSRILRAHGCFGEPSLAGLPIRETVTAREKTTCLMLPRGNRFGGSETLEGMQSLVPVLSSIQKAYTWIGQRDRADCGVACLAMIANGVGKKITFDEVRNHFELSASGTTMKEIVRVAQVFGLSTRALRIPENQITKVPLPGIAFFQEGHFVVVCEASDQTVILCDPMSGVIRWSRVQFADSFSGNILLFSR